MTDPLNPEQLDQWVLAYLDGVLDEASFAQLTEAMRTDPATLDRFVELAMVDRSLLDTLAHGEQVDAMNRASHEQADPALSFEATLVLLSRGSESAQLVHLHGDLTPRHRMMPYFVGATIAAMLVLAVTLTFVFSGGPVPEQGPGFASDPTPTPDNTVATLTAVSNAKWAEGASAPGSQLRPGSKLYPNTRLTLTAGFAEITTAQGAIAILQAPATIEFTDHDNALRLHAGKLVGICETESSKGFVVKTDYADITDLGTEFGVEVNGSDLTTTVFTGEVELHAPGSKAQSLTQNQTARLHTEGISREMVIEDRVASGFDKILRPAIVTDARINFDGFEVRVVPRAVREDVRLFTDRIHELNGLDANGIPEVLRGGDLVMMPADARPDNTRGSEGLELTLDIAAPADIYVLMPDISEIALIETYPEWLKKDYVQTELRVGFDRGEGTKNESAGIGPGDSIDDTFIVWKRKTTATGTIQAAYDINHTMYSLIAVPASTN